MDRLNRMKPFGPALRWGLAQLDISTTREALLQRHGMASVAGM